MGRCHGMCVFQHFREISPGHCLLFPRPVRTHATQGHTYTCIHAQESEARPEAHPQREPEQKTASTVENHPKNSAGTHVPEVSSEVAAAVADDVIDLEDIPVHLLGINAIKKGAPIGSGGMSTVFNGKFGSMPVALKQAKYSVQTLLKEAEIITKMHHPNVIQVYGIWKNAQQQVFMVFIALVISLADVVVGVTDLIKSLVLVQR